MKNLCKWPLHSEIGNRLALTWIQFPYGPCIKIHSSLGLKKNPKFTSRLKFAAVFKKVQKRVFSCFHIFRVAKILSRIYIYLNFRNAKWKQEQKKIPGSGNLLYTAFSWRSIMVQFERRPHRRLYWSGWTVQSGHPTTIKVSKIVLSWS